MLEYVPYVYSGLTGGAVVAVGAVGLKWYRDNRKLALLSGMRAAAKKLKTMDETGDVAEEAAREAKEAKLKELVKDEVAGL